MTFRYTQAYPVTYFEQAGNTTCGAPRDDAFNLIRGLDADYPWLGTLTRTTLGSLWYWCANQVSIIYHPLIFDNITAYVGEKDIINTYRGFCTI